MAARGVQLDEAEAFLNPTLRSLMPQPAALKDMEKGAVRIAAGETWGGDKMGNFDWFVEGVVGQAK